MTNPKDNSGSGAAGDLLRIGSRGSQLALWQANHIADRLRGAGYEVSIEIIKTLGDAMQHVPFSEVGGDRDAKGMFTKEIEEALYDGRIDLAVHSFERFADGVGGAVYELRADSGKSRSAGRVC